MYLHERVGDRTQVSAHLVSRFLGSAAVKSNFRGHLNPEPSTLKPGVLDFIGSHHLKEAISRSPSPDFRGAGLRIVSVLVDDA